MSAVEDWFEVVEGQPKAAEPKAPMPECTADQFSELSKEWEPLVRSGKKKAKSIISTAKTSMILTEEQQFQIDAWEKEGS